MTCDLRTTQGARKFHPLPGGKTSQGNASKASHRPAGPEVPEGALSPCRPADGQVVPSGAVPVLKGRRGLAPEMATPIPDGAQGFWQLPHSQVSVSSGEPWVVRDVTGKKIIFLTDTGATYPVLISHAGPLSSKSCSVTGVD